MTTPVRVAIVGGGWAGLSCAATLARHSKFKITVLEAAPHFGGRARGLLWNNLPIDNGQHLTLGAYRDTFALLAQVGAPQWESEPLNWCGMATHGQIAQHWQVPNRAWPLRIFMALLPGQGPRHWPWTWKLSMVRVMSGLARTQWRVPAISVGHWLSQQQVPPDLVAHFWRPLTEGALNTELEVASAPVLANVLRDSLGGPQAATEVRSPSTNLSIEGVDCITQWLSQQQVQLQAGHRVLAVTPMHGSPTTVALTVQHGHDVFHDTFDAVVLALPAHTTADLWADSGLAPTAASSRWTQLSSRAITTVWLALPPKVQAQLGHLPSWFVLNAVNNLEPFAQVAVRRPGVLGLVRSARNLSDTPMDRDHDQVLLREQLLVQLGLDIGPLDQKWITEKTATWACTVDAPLAAAEELTGATGVQGIYRAGDDLANGYPATIESAVRSGRQTAHTLMARF